MRQSASISDPANVTNIVPLEQLPDAINREHGAATATAAKAMDHARRCGELLIQAKAAVGHGSFTKWLRTNCTVKERQARNYMRVAENWGAISKTAPGADLTIKRALTLVEKKKPPSIPLSPDRMLIAFNDDAVTIITPIDGGPYYYVATWNGVGKLYAHCEQAGPEPTTDDLYADFTKRGIINTMVERLVHEFHDFKPISPWYTETDGHDGDTLGKRLTNCSDDDFLVWTTVAQRKWVAWHLARVQKSQLVTDLDELLREYRERIDADDVTIEELKLIAEQAGELQNLLAERTIRAQRAAGKLAEVAS